jgi:hypothetical protein
VTYTFVRCGFIVADIRPHLITENRTEAELALKSLPTIEQQWVGLSNNQITVSSPQLGHLNTLSSILRLGLPLRRSWLLLLNLQRLILLILLLRD